MADTMTPIQFVQKWARAELSERAASQEHFIDLCRMLGQGWVETGAGQPLGDAISQP